MSEAMRGAVAIVLAAVIWGSWRLWLTGPALDSAAQGALILTVAGSLATVLALRSRRVRAPRSAWLLLAVFGVSEAVNFLLYFGALASGDSATAAVTHYLAPVLVAVASPLIREPLGRRVPFAAPIAFLATVVLVGAGATGAGTRTAALLGSSSAVFYALNVLLSKRLSRHFSTWELVGFHNLIAAPIVWACSRTPPWTASSPELGLALGGSFVGGFVAAGLFFYGLARIPAARGAVLAYVEPVGAALVGALLLGESISPIALAAMVVIVLAGVAVATEAPAREPPRSADLPVIDPDIH